MKAANTAFLIAFGLCGFTLLSLRMPVASEIRYIESAREMVESGDWVVPTLGYVPYFEKPILLYWLAAASQLVFGDSGVAVRLPSILAATLSLYVTWEMARRLLGERGGMQAALLILGSGFFFVLGSVLITDTLFAACLWSAWYAWWRARAEHGSRWKWLYCVAAALGFMSKGPLALVLVGGSIATFQVFQEPWPREPTSRVRALAVRIVRGLRTSLSTGYVLRLVLVTLALNLPWSLAVLRRDARFLEFFYVRENFRAFFDGTVNHTQPFWFYGGILLLAFAPWSLACCAAIVVALWQRGVAAWRGPARDAREVPGTELRTYLGAIALFTLAFLQASSSKLDTYPLPILPVLAILIVDCWNARLAAPPRWLRWSPLAGALTVLVAAAIFVSGKAERVAGIPEELVQHLSIAIGLTALALLVGGVLALRGRFWTGLATGGIAFAGLVVLADARFEELGVARNVQPLARRIAACKEPGDLVLTSGQFVQDYTLQLTLHQRVGLWGRARELGMGYFAEVTPPQAAIPLQPYSVSGDNLPANPWLYTRERLVATLRSPQRVWFVGTAREVDQLIAEGLPLRIVDSARDARLATNVQ